MCPQQVGENKYIDDHRLYGPEDNHLAAQEHVPVSTP
jgi:hypothetical protein